MHMQAYTTYNEAVIITIRGQSGLRIHVCLVSWWCGQVDPVVVV